MYTLGYIMSTDIYANLVSENNFYRICGKVTVFCNYKLQKYQSKVGRRLDFFLLLC